ncbi:MAG TPA: hypothetical protein VNJ08_16765 [Bacteriovoracaceae bacterium]|nr:hypothetical protein [Bacteriovoracaceae bacterium]
MKSAFTLLILATAITSCGKIGSGSSSSKLLADQAPPPADGSNIDGAYLAKFETMNQHINGTVPGSATIHRKNDNVFAFIRLFGGGADTWHQQFITNGTRCPNAGDDLNKDGYIDIVEGNKVWGDIIIPLDSDIASQYSGKNIYPIADASGTYFYERVTSFKRLFKDLKGPDNNLKDNIAKLPSDQGLRLEGKVVVVLGVAKTAAAVFPLTVETIGKQFPFQTLPVACGLFKKVTELPGVPDDGVIPGPVAEVGADPDVPIDDGIVLPSDAIPDQLPEVPVDPEVQPEVDDDDDDDWMDRVGDWWRDIGGGGPIIFANENNEIIHVD